MSPAHAAVAGVDVAALQRYFDRHVPECAGELSLALLHGGRSNLTYEVTDGAHRWVLQPAAVGVLTPTAHDMDREYRVVAALGGTGVPVARAVLSCTDAEVIGAPFCVVDFVEGTVLRHGDEAATLLYHRGPPRGGRARRHPGGAALGGRHRRRTRRLRPPRWLSGAPGTPVARPVGRGRHA